MNTNLVNQVAVVNTTATAGIAVALGKLSVTAGAATNRGFGETIDWADIISASYSAYTAAVHPVKRVNFRAAGVTIVANSAVTLRIKSPSGYKTSAPAGVPVVSPYDVALTIYTTSPAPSAADLAAAFYAEYLLMFAGVAGMPWTMTYTAGNTFFDITTSFADGNNVNLFQYDSTVTIEGITASGVAKSITSATGANPGVFTLVSHGLSIGDVITFPTMVGAGTDLFDSLQGKTGVVSATSYTANTFVVAIDGVDYSTAAGVFASGTFVDLLYGSRIHMVQPVGTANQVLRDAPDMYVAGNTYGVITIKRYKHIKGYEGLQGTKVLYDVIYALTGQSFATPSATTSNAFTAVFTTVAAPALYLQKG